MEYLQYLQEIGFSWKLLTRSFKPCYKWNTFNTEKRYSYTKSKLESFKPCYKWNTFNTRNDFPASESTIKVLNLVINGIPSIQDLELQRIYKFCLVLNLVINGIPSILL